jgi:hypothetical protein
VDPERLEGESVTLELIGVDRIQELHKYFQDKRVYQDAGLAKPPKLKSLQEDVEGADLGVWEVIPEGESAPVALIGLVGYAGPPFIFVTYLDPKHPDLDLAQEAMVLVIKYFFENEKPDELWCYQVKPVSEEIHSRLIEGGFDLWEDDIPSIDSNQLAAYIMERHTFDAYYGEQDDEEKEVLQDY